MNMSTFSGRRIAVTNRRMSRRPFLEQLEVIAQTMPDAILLREMDLSYAEYITMAKAVLALARRHGIECILRSRPALARQLGCASIHLPFDHLRHFRDELADFQQISVSVHSTEEAKAAQQMGGTRLVAGHIFATACKQGLSPRGIEFLEEVCRSVSLPVFAIGGISADNAHLAIAAGAAGVCMMSGYMEME